MAKLFNIYIDTDYDEADYLGSYKAKTMNEAVRAALEDNGYDPEQYDKKTQTYNGYKVWNE